MNEMVPLVVYVITLVLLVGLIGLLARYWYGLVKMVLSLQENLRCMMEDNYVEVKSLKEAHHAEVEALKLAHAIEVGRLNHKVINYPVSGPH